MQDSKTFVNQQGYWSHEGPFYVELTEGADLSIVPQNAEIEPGKVTVTAENSRVYQSMGGIQIYSGAYPFYWRYRDMKAIRKMNGDLIWVNYNFR